MKIVALLIILTSLGACGKRSKNEPQPQSSKPTASRMEQWSGRSDSIDTHWQVKSQP